MKNTKKLIPKSIKCYENNEVAAVNGMGHKGKL